MKYLIRTLLILSFSVGTAIAVRAESESDFQENLKNYLELDPSSEAGRDFASALVSAIYSGSKETYVQRTKAINALGKSHATHVDHMTLALIEEYHQRFRSQLLAASERSVEWQKRGAQGGSTAGLVAFFATHRYMPTGKARFLVQGLRGALPVLGFAGGKEAGSALAGMNLEWPHPALLLGLDEEDKTPNAYDQDAYLASVGRFLLGIAVWQAVDPAVTGALRPGLSPLVNKVTGGPCNKIFGAIGHYTNYVIPTFKRYYAVLRGNKNLPLAATSMILGQMLADPIAAKLAPDMHSDNLGRLIDDMNSARKKFEAATGTQKQVAAVELRKAVLATYKKMPKLGGALDLLQRMPSGEQNEETLSKLLYESNERAQTWLQQERSWRDAQKSGDQAALLLALQNERIVHTELMLAAHAALLKREGFADEAQTLLRYEEYLNLANRAPLEALNQLSTPSTQGAQP